ncbi:DUF6997 domain-containing protein [Halorientalis brevis]|uniref:DUF6997 domain-containing protein n=1 Tax=Halorientalis brevis TaxID=1126241 RepID=A0ABD6CAN5_9EURY|nr:hypothetical protein [Halorientalis brevis]
MGDSHWTAALQQLDGESAGLYGPESFLDYLRDSGEDPGDYRTAAEISIDTRRDLATALAEHDTMILRLGRASEGRGTQFALVRVPGQLDDFFIDEAGFDTDQRTHLDFSPGGADADAISQQARDMLEVYRMLPKFSESSLVNFALSTGLLSRALDLDVEQIGAAPTTIASTFDFEFEPHRALPTVLHHNGGQVEIDAIVMTRQDGERVLVVLEAKTGRERALAKHKLCYPYLAVEQELSPTVAEIIPVYLRAQATDRGLLYDIYECTGPGEGEEQPCLSAMEVVADSHYLLELD